MSDVASTGLFRKMAVLGVLAGVYLIAAPWLLGFSSDHGATTNSWVVGVILVVLMLPAIGSFQMAMVGGGLMILAGIWLIVSPFVIGFSGSSTAGMSTWLLGIVSILIGGTTIVIDASVASMHNQRAMRAQRGQD